MISMRKPESVIAKCLPAKEDPYVFLESLASPSNDDVFPEIEYPDTTKLPDQCPKSVHPQRAEAWKVICFLSVVGWVMF